MAAVDRGTTSTWCILFDQLLSTVGYELGSEPAHCALEGSIAITGSRAVVSRWPRADPQSTGAETLAPSVDDNGGCYILPAFAGLFAPHWRSEARGVIVGLTSYVNKGHLARAVLEAVAWQTREVVDAMDADPGLALSMLRVDGGMVADQLLMQTLADVLDAPVARPMVRETVSRGADCGETGGRVLARPRGLAARLAPDGAVGTGDGPGAGKQEYENWSRAVARTFDWVRLGSADDG